MTPRLGSLRRLVPFALLVVVACGGGGSDAQPAADGAGDPGGAPTDVVSGDGSDCVCGDGVCSPACGENAALCPDDCGFCGDGRCAPGEDEASCADDCCGPCGDGVCSAVCGEDKTTCTDDCGCDPATCDSLGFDCGDPEDGCGGVLDCGTCDAPLTCGGGGDPFVCGCTPDETCGDAGRACGPFTDDCGVEQDCGACPAVDGGTQACDAGTCALTCDAGFHHCGDACADDADPATCGDRCDPCPQTVANSTPTCVEGACDFACREGLERCDDRCVDTATDPGHCGTCGNACIGDCAEGRCQPIHTLEVAAGGDQQALVTQALPLQVIIRVRDVIGNPAQGVDLRISGPAGESVSPAVATSDSSGNGVVNIRLGRAPGPRTFTVESDGADPITFGATATAPGANVVLPLVNAQHISGNTGSAGPGPAARIGEPWGLAAAPDGTLWFTDVIFDSVRRLDPAGTLSVIAGAGGEGFAGDEGPAVSARVRNPRGLAHDADRGVLYVADTGNDRLRAIDLAAGTITTVAGGGPGAPPTFGDGEVGSRAALAAPSHITVAPDGRVIIADVGHERIRAYDPATALIDGYVPRADCATAIAGLRGCKAPTESTGGCAVAFDEDGDAYITARICGSTPGGDTWGVLRRTPEGALHHVAGKANGLTADRVAANESNLGQVEGIAVAPGGAIYLVERDRHRVRRIGADGVITTVLGNGTPGDSGDYRVATSARLNHPFAVALLDAGHLVVTDTRTWSVRSVWQVVDP